MGLCNIYWITEWHIQYQMVPFNALPSRMTKKPDKVNKLFSASMMGGAIGGMLLT